MNTSQQDPNKNGATDEVDDLTRFLDEDFDTDDVDLFEFTSEEESPLTQLKSIILSLDWEITDEILQDLIDEIAQLRDQDLFESDKVSQVYLQGLDKIGHYLQSEGAYAHPNSIKLLLSLYYDFEKILSSDHITGAEITAMLKADVRKFKILQHQIAQKHGVADSDDEVGSPLPLTEHQDLQGVQAAILELDWEVTDEGLKHLADQLNGLKAQYADNHYVTVLIQGLFSLNSYLTEEKGRAHPETFSLIHNFFDALESIIEDEELDEDQKKEILVDRVNRLNNLKHLIAQTYSTEDLAPEAIVPVAEVEEELSLDEETTSGAEELLAESAADELDMEMPERDEAPASPAGAAETLVPLPGDDDDDDSEEEPLATEGGEVAPALFSSGEEAGFGSSGDLEAPPEELTDKLDFFFGETKEEFEPEAIEEEAAAKQAEAEAAEEPEPQDETEEEMAPALAGSVEDEGFTGEGDEMEAPPEELADKLDSFFGASEGETPEAEATPEVEATPEPEETPVAEEEPLVPVAGGDDDEYDEPLVAEGEELPTALADSDEEVGFGGEGAEIEAPPEELEEKLAFFFGDDEEEAPQAEAAAEPEDEPVAALDEEEEDTGEIAPALAESDEEVGFGVEPEEAEAPPEELTDKLESFFGADEEAPAVDEAVSEEEEDVLLTPALEEPADEVTGLLDEEEAPVEPITTAEEYQVAVEQMRASFKELEESMRSEMASMRDEIESLREQLNK